MAARISEAMGVEAELIPGEKGIFDVKVDGSLVYSKFETGSFPEEEPLVRQMVATYGEGSK